jgi:hypothetical protein
MFAAAYLAFFVLPNLSAETLPPSGAKRGTALVHEELKVLDSQAPPHRHLIATQRPVMLKPWGYNKERNAPRFGAIAKSIAEDKRHKFTLIDYGADQGYFSISTAHMFPGALVMGVELGGVGGQIWLKGKSKSESDVLDIQESHLRAYGLSNVIICQAKMETTHFTALREQKAYVDYQLMLSVFHWFKLPTRRDFERAITTLFLNARTTFIELPTIGDNKDPLIKKQVGYEYFSKWYDGRTDLKQIIADACAAEGVDASVELVVSFPWLKWARNVFRVDVVRYQNEDFAHSFQCEARKRIYGCKPRPRYFNCPPEG